MSTVKISALTASNTIDGSNDYVPIVQSNVTKKINRTTLLGISGSPVGTSDSQTLSGKVLDNSNTLTVKDGSYTLQNTADTTKQVKWSLSGITTGTTRTLTLPNRSDTLVTLAGTETLTNKTITSPTITGGTIDNSTITVDSISGHTSATLVTVGGVQMNNGTIGTSGAVTSTSIAVGAVQPQALTTGTGTGWAWSSWTPTWTNVTIGTSTVIAKYIQIGKTVFFRVRWTLDGSIAVTGDIQLTVPVTPQSAYYNVEGAYIGHAKYIDLSNAEYMGVVQFASTSKFSVVFFNSAGTYLSQVTATNVIPGTWSNGDELHLTGFYEAA